MLGSSKLKERNQLAEVLRKFRQSQTSRNFRTLIGGPSQVWDTPGTFSHVDRAPLMMVCIFGKEYVLTTKHLCCILIMHSVISFI
jgi:hypothetical protein